MDTSIADSSESAWNVTGWDDSVSTSLSAASQSCAWTFGYRQSTRCSLTGSTEGAETGCALPSGSSEPQGGPHVRHGALWAAERSPRARHVSLRGREVRPRPSWRRSRVREREAARRMRALRSSRAVSCFLRPLPRGFELVSIFVESLFGAVRRGEWSAWRSSWTSTRADGPPDVPSGAEGGLDVCQQVRRASKYSPPSPTHPSGCRRGDGACGRVPGLWRKLTERRGGLRTGEAILERADESHEGPARFTGSSVASFGSRRRVHRALAVSQRRDAVSRRLAPGAPRSAGMSWQPEAELLGARVTDRGRRPSLRRRLAVSRWRASTVFGPAKRNGTPRLDSSESGRRTEVVARFHGDVDASPGRLADELLGALKRICSSESSSSESGAGSGTPSVSTEVRVRSDPVPEALRSPRVGWWPVTDFQAGSDVFRGPSTLPFGARRSVREVLKGSWLLTRAEGAGWIL